MEGNAQGDYFGFGRCRSIADFVILNKLGQGTYGTVYRAKDSKTGEVVALKQLLIHSPMEGFPVTALREICILRQVSHPNIVRFHEVVVCSSSAGPSPAGSQRLHVEKRCFGLRAKSNEIFLVFEHCECDLAFLLDHVKYRFSESEVKSIIQGLLEALYHLHQNFVIHRDVKMSNLLLNSDGVLKLADFGLAREYGEAYGRYTGNVMTLWYRAPELLLCSQTYAVAVDLWAVGCVMGELLLNQPMFPGQTVPDQLKCIFRLVGPPENGFRLHVNSAHQLETRKKNKLKKLLPIATPNGVELLSKLLTLDPLDRITAKDGITCT